MTALLRFAAPDRWVDLLDADRGYVATAFDPGGPEVRDVVEDRPGANGQIDSTRLVGGRAVSVSLTLVDTGDLARQRMLDDIGWFLDPANRFEVVYSTDLDRVAPRALQVRAKPYAAPWDMPGGVDVALAFVASTPYALSDATHQGFAVPQAPPAGATFPLALPLVWPSVPTSLVQALNAGNAPADWTARIIGPVTSPRLRLIDTDESIYLPFLVIGNGEWVTLDSSERRVLAAGYTGASRYGLVDWGTSTWWRLRPGSNRVQLTASSSSGYAGVELAWRDTYLT